MKKLDYLGIEYIPYANEEWELLSIHEKDSSLCITIKDKFVSFYFLNKENGEEFEGYKQLKTGKDWDDLKTVIEFFKTFRI